jgi:carboxyl-terminal processing protease
MKKDNKVIPSLVIIVLIIGAFFVGVNVGNNETTDITTITELKNKEVGKDETIDFSIFWEAWSVINQKFVGEQATDQEKVWGAISGLAESLGDPYTEFFPPAESELFEENISGNFGGVGMEIATRDGILTVVAPLKDTPAYIAGIEAGDFVVGIDGTPSAEMRVGEAVSLIRGEIGTEVILTLIRDGVAGPFDIPVIRGNITIPTLETELRDDGIFVISLFNFSAVSPNLFREALREFVLSNGEKLILDLRGNPGGFLQAATDIASWFLPMGKVVVTEDYGDKREDIVHRSTGYDIFNDNLRFAILVNQGSASASEILAGALMEHDKATVIGAQTFGKGSVQELIKITPETSLKLTIARWLTPLGNSISENGITPDIEVKVTREQIEAGEDPQLERAVEILLQD